MDWKGAETIHSTTFPTSPAITPPSVSASPTLAPDRFRLRDLIDRSQLQYIDYKVEYGLRYNPAVFASKFKRLQQTHEQRPQHPISTMLPVVPSNDTLTAKGDNVTAVNIPGVNESSPLIVDSSSLDSENIMRPPTRVETAFELLGDRLRVLLLNSLVPNSTESRVIEKLKSPLSSLFSVFNVIKFENRPCIARREQQLATFYGICYHEMECSQLGGVPMDVCAGGFGVCCVFQLGCNDQTAQNISYFQSPNYPAAVRSKLTCTFSVALRWNVRQVLLEFIFFEMGPPSEGNCLNDQLIVTVQNGYSKYPVLCGINSGQHLYIQVDRDYSYFLHLTAVSNSNEPKAFNIRITQLTTPEAPEGCLQYYTGINGYIKSFNYDNQSAVVTERNPSYLNNLNYAICIRRAPNFCAVTFENIGENGEENQFQLVNLDEDGASLIRPGTAGVEIYNCPDDFIAINYLRLCGDRLNDGATTEDYTRNSPVLDDSGGPLVVGVRTNAESVGRGFKLRYRQEICQKT
ncbi:AAEL008087-PA [Aedes aegypti]|uniref:AAEL008087-PA n=1 Tax=Aedes aegypti TaxID=7159 RepID=Q16ZQ3_AEDAE|nr:AAEL008087-PA [Aedes aegypti]